MYELNCMKLREVGCMAFRTTRTNSNSHVFCKQKVGTRTNVVISYEYNFVANFVLFSAKSFG